MERGVDRAVPTREGGDESVSDDTAPPPQHFPSSSCSAEGPAYQSRDPDSSRPSQQSDAVSMTTAGHGTEARNVPGIGDTGCVSLMIRLRCDWWPVRDRIHTRSTGARVEGHGETPVRPAVRGHLGQGADPGSPQGGMRRAMQRGGAQRRISALCVLQLRSGQWGYSSCLYRRVSSNVIRRMYCAQTERDSHLHVV